jgi:Flp pilus assembly protein TadG
MKKQKGQVIVEFALILPLFLLMIFGLIYSGMLFHDYSTLSNVARSATREVAISSDPSNAITNVRAYYYDETENRFTQGIITNLYVPSSSNPFTIDPNSGNDGKDIVTTINMTLNVKFPLIDMVLPENFSIVYHMRKDS